MGRKSLRKDKSIYQKSGERASLTRRQASEQLGFLSENRIEKIESGKSQIQPAEVLAMETVYHDPLLINHHCTKNCLIGMKTVPAIRKRALSETVLDLLLQKNRLDKQMENLMESVCSEADSEESRKVIEEVIRTASKIGRISEEMKLHVFEGEKENEKKN